MGKIKVCTWEGYENSKVSFRDVQKSKEKFNSHLRQDEDWEYYTYLTRKKMTNSRAELQKEYNAWDKSRYRHDIIYFIV